VKGCRKQQQQSTLSALSSGYVISLVSCSLKVHYLRTKTITCLHHNTSKFRYHQSVPEELLDPLAQRTVIKISFTQAGIVNPPRSTGLPRSNASRLSAAIALSSLQVSPTISSSSSSICFLQLLLGIPLPLCPCGFQLKACFYTEEESSLNVGPIYCHFRSYFCTVTTFSCAPLHKSSLQVMLSQKTFKIFYSTCVFVYIYIYIYTYIKVFFDKSIFCPKISVHILFY
jgi:hypothetical protein